MRAALILALLGALPLLAAPPSTCGGSSDYDKALCAYQQRRFDEAAAGFRAVAAREEQDDATLKATYFLARTEMKRGRWEEAERLLIRIYGISKAFYDSWNGDYLLGVCRAAEGKG